MTKTKKAAAATIQLIKTQSLLSMPGFEVLDVPGAREAGAGVFMAGA